MEIDPARWGTRVACGRCRDRTGTDARAKKGLPAPGEAPQAATTASAMHTTGIPTIEHGGVLAMLSAARARGVAAHAHPRRIRATTRSAPSSSMVSGWCVRRSCSSRTAIRRRSAVFGTWWITAFPNRLDETLAKWGRTTSFATLSESSARPPLVSSPDSRETARRQETIRRPVLVPGGFKLAGDPSDLPETDRGGASSVATVEG